MYILGINAYHADASACIYQNQHLIAASEEERFRRIKHWAGFPSQAIQFCLNEAKITIDQVDYIAISRDPKANLLLKAKMAVKNKLSLKSIVDRVNNLQKAASIHNEFALHFGLSPKEFKKKIINVEHHRSHLASAFFASPFEEAALLSIDGFGDFSSTMTAVGKINQIKVYDTVSYPHSAGLFFTMLTQFLGFPHYGDEYKIMGLAPYGKPVLVEQLKKIIRFKNDGLFELNLAYFNHHQNGVKMSWDGGIPHVDRLFSDKLIELLGPIRKSAEPLTDHHKNIAASVQTLTEQLIFHILQHLHEKTGLKNICIAGGVAQNSVANGKIIAHTGFENLYIPPAGHDAGTAIGAALWAYHQVLGRQEREIQTHAYFGSRYDSEEIETLLESKGIIFEKLTDDLNHQVTDCLINGGVVGWFQGRAEFGPRALGHRSILADPRREDAKELLNSKIKRRESFRPFAPSILKEFVNEYFENCDKVPFMEKVFQIKKDKHAIIPAVTHIDGTGRLQTVDQQIEPKYYSLIQNFYQKTGVPILLNTSFNENEPIVDSPAQALDCFLRTDMDMLVMEDLLIRKANQN